QSLAPPRARSRFRASPSLSLRPCIAAAISLSACPRSRSETISRRESRVAIARKGGLPDGGQPKRAWRSVLLAKRLGAASGSSLPADPATHRSPHWGGEK